MINIYASILEDAVDVTSVESNVDMLEIELNIRREMFNHQRSLLVRALDTGFLSIFIHYILTGRTSRVGIDVI